MGWLLNWLTRYEAVAVWLEGLALVAIFVWDRLDARATHEQTLEQLKLAQAQIKVSQDAERAWVLTELRFSDSHRSIVDATIPVGLKVQETTNVAVVLKCRNEGRCPAWIEGVTDWRCEIFDRYVPLSIDEWKNERRILGLSEGIGTLAPKEEREVVIDIDCRGHVKPTQDIGIYLEVTYRDSFASGRITSCCYTLNGIGTKLYRNLVTGGNEHT